MRMRANAYSFDISAKMAGIVKLIVIFMILSYCHGQNLPTVKGQKGEPGGAGPPGAPGPRGESGFFGPKGDPGAVGIPGAVGRTGPPGPRGATGETGPPGYVAGLFWFGDRGPPGNDGLVGIPGDIGDVGSKGSRGFPGNLGPAGRNGHDGANGSPGARGPSGPTGLEGSKGAFYIHWGKHSNCSSGALAMYEGYSAHRNDSGFFCLLKELANEDTTISPGTQSSGGAIVENIPCTLCYQSTSFDTFTLPGRISCPDGYGLEYDGYCATSSTLIADPICVDWTNTEVTMAESEGTVKLIMADGPTSGEGYIPDRPMACAVCSKS